MDDTLNKLKGYEYWGKTLEAVQDAKGLDSLVLDLEGQCSWTDYMLIVTATSRMHLRGIKQKVLDILPDEENLQIRNSKNTKNEDQWILMDCGALVVQIMTAEAREYYDLEAVWFASEALFREEA